MDHRVHWNGSIGSAPKETLTGALIVAQKSMKASFFLPKILSYAHYRTQGIGVNQSQTLTILRLIPRIPDADLLGCMKRKDVCNPGSGANEIWQRDEGMHDSDC